ncbi:hypothetical protein CRI77_04130 [Mycolicibacterium duvalii]|nr:hypothetical protein CRI77_04130 [Mycolicibacterium duvalii]
MGALAVSLGIGFAVANSSGVAYADTDGDSSVSASRDNDATSSAPRRQHPDRTAPSDAGSSSDVEDEQGPEDLDDETLDDADLADLEPGDSESEVPDPDVSPGDDGSEEQSSGDASDDPPEPAVSDETAADGQLQRRNIQQAAVQETAQSPSESGTVADDADVTEPEPDVTAADATAEPQAESVTVDLTDTDTDTDTDSTTATTQTTTATATTTDKRVAVASAFPAENRVETVDMMTALVSNVVAPFADPAAPARAPWFDAFLAWVRRQITHTFFNRTPVWGPVESHQLLTGQVEFDLNARDPNDDPLTYKISQPAHGLVVRNPLTDTFIYTPTLPVTGQPLQDTFYVTISDSSEHLKGIGGVIQGIFHSLARIIGIAQRDEVTLAVSVTANPIVEVPPVVVVTPVATGLVGTAVRVSPVVVITDLDSEEITSATVTVNDAAADDVLSWGDLPTGVSAAVGEDGVVTFTGAASAAAYQQLLQTVTLTSEDIGVKTVSFAVIDDQGKTNVTPAATVVTIVGLPVEVPPLVVVSPVAAGRVDGPIRVSPIVVITDVDSDVLTSATVRITDPSADDSLGWGTLPPGMTVTTGDGWVTFTGDASAEAYQELLASVTLTSAAPGLKAVAFSVVDDDGNASSVPARTAVTVLGLPVDVPPLIVVTPVATGTAGAPITVSPIVVITDLDSDLLDSATVTLNDVDDGDVLGYGTLPTGVSATYDDGVLTFTGEASLADYQQLLRTVTLTSPAAGLKSVSFTVTDVEGNASSVPAATVVTVLGLPVDVPPLVVVSPVAAGVAGSAIRISPIVVITDLDSGDLRSATVTLAGAEEADVFGYGPLPTNVSAGYVDGVLTFTGDASVADYQALLASVTLTSPDAGLKTISFSVTDVDGNTSTVPAGTVVTVVGLPVTEIAPVVLVTPVAAGVVGSSVSVSPIVVITDLDSDQLHAATVTLEEAQPGDALGFTAALPTGVAAGYSDGVLTFTGGASVEEYRQLLASVTLTSDTAGLKAVSFTVTDLQGNTSVVPAASVVTVVGLPGVSIPPVVVVSPVAAGTVGKPTTVSPVVVITDLDSSQLGSATVTLAGAQDGDILAIDAGLPDGMQAGYADGVLTLTGAATVEQYRALLQSVTLTSVSAGLKTVSFSVTDLDGADSLVEAGTLVTVVGLSADVPPLVLVSPVAAGVTGSAIVVSPIVIITDPDSAQLHSATVTVGGGTADDVLDFTGTLPSGVDVSYGTGTLTFTGDASAAAYQALLQSVTLTSAGAGVKTVSFSLTDTEGATSVVPAGTVVTVVGVPGGLSMAPVVVVTPVAAGTVGEPTTVSPIVLITDLDSTEMDSATVTLADAEEGDELVVDATLPSGVEAFYAGGVLTITGTATVEQYQQMLQSVTLTTVSAGVKAVSFTVTDADGATSAVLAGTLVTMVGLSTEVPPLVLVAPVATGIAGSAIRVSPIVVLTDPDSDQVRSATVTLGTFGAGDVLAVSGALPSGVQAEYSAGVLTLTGNASVAQYQDLLQRVTLTAASGGLKTVSFAVTDGEGKTSVVPAGTAVTVVGLLDLSLDPVVVVSPVAAGTVGDAITVSPVVIITDLDSTFLRSASVTLDDPAAGDVLGYTAALPSGVEADYTDGVLTFTGTATVSEYEALLASVTLTSDTAGLKTVSYTVTDSLFHENAVAAVTAVTVLGLPETDIPPVVVVSLVAAGAVGRAIRISPLTVIRDLDSAQLTSATVTLTDPDGGDVLDLDAEVPDGMQVDYADGVLTLSGTASVEQYQTLLRSVTLTSTTAGVQTVSFAVTDLGGTTSVLPAITAVTVVGVPATSFAPVVVASPVAAGTTGSTIAVSPVLVIADVDSETLTSATVTIEGYQDGDVLDFDPALAPDILGSYANGLLTFSGDASVADYQALLRSVTVTSTDPGIRTVSFEVTDAGGAANVVPAATVVTVVGVAGVSLPPLVVASPVAAGRTGTPITVSPVLVVTDVDSALLGSAAVTIDDYQAGDLLDFDAALADGLLADYTDGVLTFTGDASAGDYQALLRSVTLTSAGAGIKTVSFTVTDLEGTSSILPAVTAVTVVGAPTVSLAPVVVVTPVAVGVVGDAITVSPIAVITDLDSDGLQSATVRVVNAADTDVLSFDGTLPSGVTVEYAAGEVTFTGPAAAGDYQNLLAAVSLTSQTSGLKTVSFTVTDLEGRVSTVPAATVVTVVGVPDVSIAPVVVVSPVAAGSVGAPITISPVVVITDLDSDDLQSATVTVGGAVDGDVMSYNGTLPDGIDVDYTDGVLTFTGNATVEQYRSLLEAVTLTSTAEGVKTLSFAVTDAEGVASALPAGTVVTVVGLPELLIAPVVVVSPVAAGVAGSAITVSPVLAITDLDSGIIRSATVTVAGAGVGDELDYTGTLPPDVVASAVDGTLTFTGNATVAEYQALLATVTLTSTTPGVKAVSFTVTDIDTNTSTVAATTMVTVVDAPLDAPPLVVVRPATAGTVGDAILVSPIVVITDLDSSHLGLATVTVEDWAADDVLGYTAALVPQNVDADFTGGVLTFTGDATVAEYQALLASVTLTSQAPGLKAVSFTVTDAQDNVSTLPAGTVVTVAALPVAVAPLVVVLPTAVGAVGEATTVSPVVVIADLDSSHLGSATVTVEDWAADDVLGYTAALVPQNVDADFTGGVLTFTGDATVAEYQALLASVTLTSQTAGLKEITFTVVDAETTASTVPAGTVVTVVGLQSPVAPLVLVAPLTTGTVGQAITVSPTVAIGDLDSDQLESAGVTIENYTAGDTLSFTAVLPEGVDVENLDGVLTFTGPASIDQYRALLASVKLTSTATGLKSVSFTVTDAEGNVNTVPAGTVVTVVGLPTEVAPLVVVTPVIAGAVGDTITVSPTVLISDLDSEEIDSATVTVGNWQAGDVLGFTAALPATVDANLVDGVLTFAGPASLTEYRALLESVTLTSASAGLKTISFAVVDGELNESAVPASTVVTVAEVPTEVAPLVLVTPVATGSIGDAITVSPTVAISDLDSEQIDRATVTIENLSAGDVLGYTAALPTDVDAVIAGGVLTFTGPASLAEYRALLESVTMTASAPGLKAISFTVTDADGNVSAVPATTVVTVVGLPTQVTPLVIVTPAVGGTVDEPITVSPIVVISDLDSDELESATVTIGNLAGGDVLGFTASLPGGIDANIVDGVLTFSGTASVATYQQLLQSVTLTSTTPGLRAVSFTVTDADNNESDVLATTVVTVLGLPTAADPLVLTSLVSVNYTAGAAGATVDPGLLVLDADSEIITGATVTIVSPGADDTLSFGPTPEGVTGTFSDGVLTFDGDASVADYQALLRSVTFSTGSSALAAIRTITFTVTDDQQGVSAPGMVAVTIAALPVLATPVVVTSLASIDYTAGESAKQVDPNLLLLDADSSEISGAVIRIVGGAAAGESLGFTMPSGVDLDYTYDAGVLTFTETASKAVYQELLRSITFTADTDALATIKSISFVVTDAENNTSNTGLVAVTIVKAPLNVAPLVVTSVVNVNYTAGNAATDVDPGLTLLDLDSDALSGATATISGGFASGDTLTFDETLAAQLGITGSYNSDAGVLTFTNAVAIEDYQQLLRSVQLSTGSAALAAIKTVSFQVTDRQGATSLPGSVAVTVLAAPSNIAPLVATIPVGPVYTAGNTAVAVNPLLTVADLDSDNLTGAVVEISGGFAEGDVLTFTPPEGSQISGLDFDSETGRLTIVGPGTLEQYQEALRSVRFASSGPSLASIKTITFTVTDEHGATSVPGLVTLTVVANTPPLLTTALPVSTYSRVLGGLLTLSPLTTIVDDSSFLTSATVTIGGAHSNDQLDFTPTGDIDGSYQDSVLTLSGQGTVAEYVQVLRSVTFETSGLALLGVRTITFQVVDLQGLPSNESVLLLTIVL